MSNIKVTIYTMGGEDKEVLTPLDMNVDEFIKELIGALNYPSMDSEGNLISWRLDNKTSGFTLDGTKTMQENNVTDDNKLSLIRTVTAGDAVSLYG